IAGVDLDVTLRPERRWYHVSGHYALTNYHADPMRQIPLSTGFHWDSLKWTVNGAAFKPEDRSHLCVFTLRRPLAHDDSVTIGFSYDGVFPKGVSKNGGTFQQFVLPSGVVLTGFEAPTWVPYVGYVPEIGVEEDRNKAEPRVYPDSFYVGVNG